MITTTSIQNAIRGLKLVLSRERNARIHLVFAILAVIISLALRVTSGQFSVIMLAIIMVFFAEIVNTAIEKTLDLTYQENSQLVRFIKDTTAAGVLVTAGGSIIIAILIFGPHIVKLFRG